MKTINVSFEQQAKRIIHETKNLIARFILDHNNIEYDNPVRDFMSLPKEYQEELANDFNEKFEVHIDHIMDMNSRLEKFEIRIKRKDEK